MSETGFRLFNAAFSAAAEGVYAACLTLFLRPFAAKRRRLFLVFRGYPAVCLLCGGFSAPQGTFGLLLALPPRTAARTGCFLDIAAKLGQGAADSLETGGAAEVSKKTEASAVDA